MSVPVIARPKLKQIFLAPADEIADKHPHAQLLFDTAGPPGFESMGHNGLFVNVACPALADSPNLPDVEVIMQQLADFEDSDAQYMRFESPHIGGAAYYLKRAALPHIIAVCPAWSAKTRPRVVSDGFEYMDPQTGKPIVQR